MEEYKNGYHITKKNNLFNIQKNGLQPRIGRRSNSVDECNKILSFTPQLSTIPIWKERLYENLAYDELVILKFDLDNVEYYSRYDSAGDFFTECIIPPYNIKLIKIRQKDSPQIEVSIDNLKNVLRDISNNRTESNYEICEENILKFNIEKPQIDEEKRKEIIEKLAEYEHKKWSDNYSLIDWHGKKDDYGNLIISDAEIENYKKYSSLTYDEIEDFYKADIRKKVMESFYIIEENNIIDYIDLSSEELIDILARTEYERNNRWFQYMMSCCRIEDEKYIIPNKKAEIWEKQMLTPYNELSDSEKDADKREVYNIFKELDKSIKSKQEINEGTRDEELK